MEIRAPYALIGLFVLVAIGAVFGFVYWMHNAGGLQTRTTYQVRFENTVAGLLARPSCSMASGSVRSRIFNSALTIRG
jgi:ABC-type transporter Mla subunit MlaD